MLKIAICDDNKIAIEKISEILWKCKNEVELEWKSYQSGESLIKAIKEKEEFDLIFLDIEMGELSGIDVANILRNELDNYSVQIAFVTTKENRAKEACRQAPLDFIDKPVNKEKILSVIDRTTKIIGDNRRYFGYVKEGKQLRTLYKDIYFFKSEGKTITMQTVAGKIDFRGSLKEIEEKLGNHGFVRIYKSYIINSRHIEYILKDDVKMTVGEPIPVSRDYKKALTKYLAL